MVNVGIVFQEKFNDRDETVERCICYSSPSVLCISQTYD